MKAQTLKKLDNNNERSTKFLDLKTAPKNTSKNKRIHPFIGVVIPILVAVTLVSSQCHVASAFQPTVFCRISSCGSYLHHRNDLISTKRSRILLRQEKSQSSEIEDEITSSSDEKKKKKKKQKKRVGFETYPARYLDDNGLKIMTDESGRVTARPRISQEDDNADDEEGKGDTEELMEQPQSSSADEVTTTKESPAEPDIVEDEKIEPPSTSEDDTSETRKMKLSTPKKLSEHVPPPKIPNGFNVVLTHCTADFDSLASAVGLAKLWSHPHGLDKCNTFGEDGEYDDFDCLSIPTFVVLPRGAHPGVQRFLSLHKHLFPIRSLRSLPDDLSGLNRLGLVDAQRRDRVGPAEHLISLAKRVTVVDHHIDSESDIPEASDYVVEKVGSVSTLVAERLHKSEIVITEAEATLLALGIHADTGSLTYDSTTPRDAKALSWVMEQGASQTAIAEHVQGGLSAEQQGVLTQALLNLNSTDVHGVTVSTVLLSTEGFISGLAAVTTNALELSGSDVLLLAVVYDAKTSSKRKNSAAAANLRSALVASSQSQQQESDIIHAEAWKGGEEAMKRRRLRAAFDKRDVDGNGFLERNEIVGTLSNSGVIASNEAIDSVLDQLDANSDGKIDFDEFLAFTSSVEKEQQSQEKLTGRRASTMIVIGRVKTHVNLKHVNLNRLLQNYGGGGHAKAASTTVRLGDEEEAGGILENMVKELIETSLLEQPTVGDFMTAPVLCAKPDMNEGQVEDLFTRYDVRALPVVDDNNDVIGLVTYKEVAAAKQRLWNKEQKRLRSEKKRKEEGVDVEKHREKVNQRKLGSALKGWMKQHVRIVEASMTMAEAENVLLANDVGCVPVVAEGTKQLVGMVTRTDLLRQHRYYPSLHYHNKGFSDSIAARKPIIELRRKLKRFDIEDE